MRRIPTETHWCYFRNSLHAIYREIRHITPYRDRKAAFNPGPEFSNQAIKCRVNWDTLESGDAYRDAVNQARSKGQERCTDPYVDHYQKLTGLTPEQVRDLFGRLGWSQRCGGERWAKIANTVIELRAALDSSNVEDAERACKALKGLEHNSGPLVPPVEEWRPDDSWQRKKWPELCED